MIRRAVLCGGLSLALLGRGAAPAKAQANDAERATAFIRKSGEELGAIVQARVTESERRQRLRAFLDRVVDVDGLAHFCLGRFWAQASEAQRATYTSLYHGVLLNAVLARVGDYGGPEMRTIYGHVGPREDVMLVPTTLQWPTKPPANLTWALRMDGPAPRIVDLIVEGTSLRVTVRSDYAAFLNSHGNSIDVLIEAMRSQATPPGG